MYSHCWIAACACLAVAIVTVPLPPLPMTATAPDIYQKTVTEMGEIIFAVAMECALTGGALDGAHRCEDLVERLDVCRIREVTNVDLAAGRTTATR